MKELYHFTSYNHMMEIIAAGKITRTQSNLLYPTNMRIENRAIVSDTDDYKPVVWLTDSISPRKQGIDVPDASPEDDKHRILMVIDPVLLNVKKWTLWADENNMEPTWRAQLTAGQNCESWYITESEIPITAVTRIIDRFKKVEYGGYRG